jgi:hypothetical protein
MDSPGVDGTAAITAAAIAAAVEAPGAHTATSAAATRISVIGDERGGQKNEGRNKSEKITEHGKSSLDIGMP